MVMEQPFEELSDSAKIFPAFRMRGKMRVNLLKSWNRKNVKGGSSQKTSYAANPEKASAYRERE